MKVFLIKSEHLSNLGVCYLGQMSLRPAKCYSGQCYLGQYHLGPLQSEDQGVRILGTPLGHPDYVRAQLQSLSATHDQLIEKVPHVARFAVCLDGVVVLLRRSGQLHFAGGAHHDASLHRCLTQLLGVAFVLGRPWTPKRHIDVPTRTGRVGQIVWQWFSSDTRQCPLASCKLPTTNTLASIWWGYALAGHSWLQLASTRPSWEELAYGVRPEPVVWDAVGSELPPFQSTASWWKAM